MICRKYQNRHCTLCVEIAKQSRTCVNANQSGDNVHFLLWHDENKQWSTVMVLEHWGGLGRMTLRQLSWRPWALAWFPQVSDLNLEMDKLVVCLRKCIMGILFSTVLGYNYLCITLQWINNVVPVGIVRRLAVAQPSLGFSFGQELMALDTLKMRRL